MGTDQILNHAREEMGSQCAEVEERRLVSEEFVEPHWTAADSHADFLTRR